MKTTESFSLERLTTYKENGGLEVKSGRGGVPSSLWETYSAFANTDGGVIVLGVNEKGHGRLVVEGLPDAYKTIKDFWNMVNNRQKVSSNILTDSMAYVDQVEGKDVIVIHVPRAERTSRPVYVGADPRTGTYRRNFEGDDHCSLEEVALMMRDSSLVTDDNRLLTELDMTVFCPETVKAYRNIFKLIRSQHLWNHEDDTMFLRRIGAVREDKDTGRFHPTVAGLLMFGYEYEITTVFPNYFLDYQENRSNGMYARWTDRITSQSGDWSGNVFDFIGRRGVVVQKSPEGFRFANPGSMRVSLNEALQDSASDPRNGVMMKMLAMVEYGERAGSGLQGIFKTWQSVYHCAPKLEVTTTGGVDRTTLTLEFQGRQPDIPAMRRLYGVYDEEYALPEVHEYSVVQEPDAASMYGTTVMHVPQPESLQADSYEGLQDSLVGIKSNRDKVLRVLSMNSTMTLEEVAQVIGMSRIGVQKIVGTLKHEGVLSRRGSNKKGEWIVKGGF